MVATFEIRRPALGDFDSCLECLNNYRLHPLQGTRSLDADFPEDAILTVRNRPALVDFSHRTLVAVRDGAVLGFCCWDWLDVTKGVAKTVLISVRPEARAWGVGDALQIARLSDIRATGAVEVHTWRDDPRVVNWYCKKFGYERLAQEPIHHTMHLFVCGDRSAWAIHRGHAAFSQLTHLRLSLAQPTSATSNRPLGN